MAAFRYPVLVLEAHQGMYTAHLVENVVGTVGSAIVGLRASLSAHISSPSTKNNRPIHDVGGIVGSDMMILISLEDQTLL